MKPYLAFFRMRFLTGLQYRAAAWAGVATQFAWGAMEILLYRAFYRADASAFPMTFPQLTSYIWLQQAMLALFMAWDFEDELFEMIRNGNVAYELCRPTDLYAMWLFRGMAQRLARAVLRCMPILVVAVLLPAPWGIAPPASAGAAGLFLLSSLLGLLVVSAMGMVLYALTFYTLSPLGLRVIFVSLADLLTGGVIPLPFFPDGIREAVELLPFASIQNMPLLIYGGHTGGAAALRGVGLQLFWVAALVLAGRLILRRALRRVVAQGG